MLNDYSNIFSATQQTAYFSSAQISLLSLIVYLQVRQV